MEKYFLEHSGYSLLIFLWTFALLLITQDPGITKNFSCGTALLSSKILFILCLHIEIRMAPVRSARGNLMSREWYFVFLVCTGHRKDQRRQLCSLLCLQHSFLLLGRCLLINLGYTSAMFLDLIHRPVFISKHFLSETEFCLRLQVKPQFDPFDRASPYLTSKNIIFVLIYHHYKHLDLIKVKVR
jgi:hypothetical protein